MNESSMMLAGSKRFSESDELERFENLHTEQSNPNDETEVIVHIVSDDESDGTQIKMISTNYNKNSIAMSDRLTPNS